MVISLEMYRRTKKMSLSVPFSEQIKIARQNQGETQDTIGSRVGCDRSTVSRWETGAMDINPEDAVSIVKALNKPDLLGVYCRECAVARYERMCQNPKPAA